VLLTVASVEAAAATPAARRSVAQTGNLVAEDTRNPTPETPSKATEPRLLPAKTLHAEPVPAGRYPPPESAPLICAITNPNKPVRRTHPNKPQDRETVRET